MAVAYFTFVLLISPALLIAVVWFCMVMDEQQWRDEFEMALLRHCMERRAKEREATNGQE